MISSVSDFLKQGSIQSDFCEMKFLADFKNGMYHVLLVGSPSVYSLSKWCLFQQTSLYIQSSMIPLQ